MFLIIQAIKMPLIGNKDTGQSMITLIQMLDLSFYSFAVNTHVLVSLQLDNGLSPLLKELWAWSSLYNTDFMVNHFLLETIHSNLKI